MPEESVSPKTPREQEAYRKYLIWLEAVRVEMARREVRLAGESSPTVGPEVGKS